MNSLERLRAMELWRERMGRRQMEAALVRSSDAVTFSAPCPACGRDCEWAAGRVDSAVVNQPLCPCPSGDASDRHPAA